MELVVGVVPGPFSETLGAGLGAMLRCLTCSDAVHSLGLSVAREPEVDDLYAAWCQANWELLVEGPLERSFGIVLEPYDGEADVWPKSSRVIRPEATASHRVVFRVQSGTIEKVGMSSADCATYQFDGFVDMSSGWPQKWGNLQYVVDETGEVPRAFRLAEVAFELVPVR